MGSDDLIIDDKGKVLQGRAGFRSFTYAPLTNFTGLGKVPRDLHPTLDTRKEKRSIMERVQNELRDQVAFYEGYLVP